MYRTIVNTKTLETFIPLPKHLRNLESVELIIAPVPAKKNKTELKKRLEKVFKKARDLNISKDMKLKDLSAGMAIKGAG